MVASKGDFGWWNGKGYRVLTKRKKKLVDRVGHRVVELELVYDPMKKDPTLLTTQDWGNFSSSSHTLWVPVGQFNKLFKLDNTIGLLFEKESSSKET